MKGIYSFATKFTLLQVASAYDSGIKPCWDIRLSQDAFCHDAIKYPLSTDTFYDTKVRDDEARGLYALLREKWEAGGKGSPSNHCLAIARDFYCFTKFPRCQDNDTQETALCEHTCATWLERCVFEEQGVCNNTSDSESCTYARLGIESSFTAAILGSAVMIYLTA